jgi:mannose-1-phosphate guanylyltransferase
MKKNIYVVIMAGGTGTRFWPYSRNNKPKQFLDIIGTGRSLLQMTYDRFIDYTTQDKIWIVSNELYQEVIEEQLPGLSKDQVLLEPLKRNTAPCIAYAVNKIKQIDPEAVLVITPSDHFIQDNAGFISTINVAVEEAALNQNLVTIGIEPHRPETGYGYIQYHEGDSPVKKVKTFTEKPNRELAEKFIESGDFVWNAGIFVWSVAAISEAFTLYQPELAETFEEGSDKYFTPLENEFIKSAYAVSKSISIDFAVMEKAKNVYVVLGNFGWSDLGSWDALHEMKKKDANENVIEGSAILYNADHNYIKTKKEKLIVLSDLSGYLIADFEDVLLICKKDDTEKFKSFVNEVKSLKGDKYV